jgi:hypothetical protein
MKALDEIPQNLAATIFSVCGRSNIGPQGRVRKDGRHDVRVKKQANCPEQQTDASIPKAERGACVGSLRSLLCASECAGGGSK